MLISETNPTSGNAASREELLSAKKALFIGAHPDDIEFYCGGTICLMRERGIEVIYAIATRGGKGRRGNALARLESFRTRHQNDAARVLGVSKVEFLDYPDKALRDYVEGLSRDLRWLVNENHPDVVLSWDPDFIYNPHPDHQAAADAVRLSIGGERLVFYGTREPNLWIGFDEPIFRTKLRSIRAHRTETPWYYWPYQKRLLVKKTRGEGSKIGEPYAEVFRVLL